MFNKHPAGFDIVITPATLLASQFRTSTIGILMEKSKKDRQWKSMPNIIFGIENNSENPILERCGFGHINSFKSNELFTAKYDNIKNVLSHCERINF